MKVRADNRATGAFVYFGADPVSHKGMPGEAVGAILNNLAIPLPELKMSVFKTPFKEGRWRGFQWKAAQEALDDPDVEVLNVRAGASEDFFFSAKFQVRSDPDPRRTPLSPRRFYFVCNLRPSQDGAETRAARELLRVVARMAAPISGGVMSAPTFPQANCEVEDGGDRDNEPAEFQERIRVDRRFETDRWTKARRLYPITLLGPKLASQVTAADALAAGALAVQEINGSLLIDSYPTVVETWDPEYLKATVNLRKWLWPHTIQNPADAVGLGLKLPKH
jgi:hypothetical protein